MNWCCQTWLDLGPELSELKVKSLDKLLKRGIPRSTFSPVFRIIEGMTNFCPLCGTKINTNATAPVAEKVKEEVKPFISKVPSTIKCPPCRGTGMVGDGLTCMTCLGEKVLGKDNPHRRQFDPSFAEEEAEKLEHNNRRIAKIEAEIQKNPKPLREDAKPHNWEK